MLIPRKIRHFLRTKKHLLINGEMINWQSLVKTGDTIHLIFDDDDYPQKEIPFGQAELVDCLYQDEHLIIVNKPEGMKTHGNEPNEIALLNHVSAYVGQTCYVIHRLDMETSGAVMFAKNPFCFANPQSPARKQRHCSRILGFGARKIRTQTPSLSR